MGRVNKKYWYKYTTYYCPMCGSENVFKERIFTKKPKDYNKRHLIRGTWDYCGVF